MGGRAAGGPFKDGLAHGKGFGVWDTVGYRGLEQWDPIISNVITNGTADNGIRNDTGNQKHR